MNLTHPTSSPNVSRAEDLGVTLEDAFQAECSSPETRNPASAVKLERDHRYEFETRPRAQKPAADDKQQRQEQ